jgi:ABC-type multidrug transport system fused ATPase/permease subunit
MKSQNLKLVKSKQIFNLLERREKKKILILTLLQISSGILDLIGVAFVGAIGALAVSGVESAKNGDRVNFILSLLNISKLSFQAQVVVLGFISVFFFMLKTVLSVTLSRKSIFFLSFVSAKVSSNLISSFLKTSLMEVKRNTLQKNIFSLTEGVDKIVLGVIATTVAVLSDLSLLFMLFGLMFVVNAQLAAASLLLFVCLGVFLNFVLSKRAKRFSASEYRYTVQSNEAIAESISSYRELFVSNRREEEAQKISAMRYKLLDARAELTFLPNVSKYVFDGVIVVGTLLVSALQFFTQDAKHATATLALFIASGSRIAPAIMRMQQSSLIFRNSLIVSNVTTELISKIGLNRNSVTSMENRVLDFEHEGFVPTIQMKSVFYKYPDSSLDAIQNVDLTIQPGDFVAIVGGSGAGKTTIVDLMLGILEPTKGQVLISDRSPLESIENWDGAIRYVPQKIVLINGTLKDNILFGQSKTNSSDRLNEVLEEANLQEFISHLPKGLDTLIGEDGYRLSGGQRQRIGIARALFSKPRLLVLDEATSSLDGISENFISTSLEKLKGKVTVITIAHRLSTVRKTDYLIYLERGKIVAKGDFETLKAKIPNFEKQAIMMGL